MPDADDRRQGGARRGISRRQLLAGGAGAGGALAVGGALSRIAAADSPNATPTYHLQALSTSEAAVLGAMADRVFPRDSDSPGAQDLGFIPYLDGQLAGSWGAGAGLYDRGPFHEATTSGMGYQLPQVPKTLYKQIAQTIDAHAQRTAGGTFASLSADQQDTIMTDLEAGKVDLGYASSVNGYTSASFFADFLGDVSQALFADPMYGGNRNVGGWEWVGYPGDPMAYGDAYWAIFSHQNDPYNVKPKGMSQSVTGGMQGVEVSG